MKVYKRKKSVLAFGITSAVIHLLYLVLAIIFLINKDYGIFIALSIFWVFIGGLFTFIVVYESKSIFVIDDDKIIFHYKVFSKSKELRGLNRKGLMIKFDDIQNIRVDEFKGDGLFIATTKSIHFDLKDKRSFDAYFHHYGKQQEKEIHSILTNR